MPAFQEFDRRAQAGARLTVVFLGASLTWGANATDPQQTSYRARLAQKLEAAYPHAHFRFWDAAVGGSDSRLGVFRLERDVLRQKPDLVFLEFSANDNIRSTDAKTLAAYETLLRRCILEAQAAVVQVILPFRCDIADGDLTAMPRRTAHYALSHAYSSAVGDAIALGIERVQSGEATLEQLWPLDGAHPSDTGYAMFADAVWDGLQQSIQRRAVCTAPPRRVNSDLYAQCDRLRLSALFPANALPSGWQIGAPNRVSAYYDMLMSRWLDDVLIASNALDSLPASLSLRFQGSSALLFGESTLSSGRYRVTLDGHSSDYDAGTLARGAGGNAHHIQILAENLDASVPHTLQISPLFRFDAPQELRLESLCIAGANACLLTSSQEISS